MTAPTDLLTIRQAAEELALSVSTLHTQVANGHLVAAKIGRDWLVTRGEVERYRTTRLGRNQGQKARA